MDSQLKNEVNMISVGDKNESNAKSLVRGLLLRKINKSESIIAKTASSDTSVIENQTFYSHDCLSPITESDNCQEIQALSMDEEVFSMTKPMNVLKVYQHQARSRQGQFMSDEDVDLEDALDLHMHSF